MIKVLIPTPLRNLTGNAHTIEVEAATVKEMVDAMEAKHPGLKERLTKEGKVRQFVNIYVNEEDMRHLQREETPLKDGDEVSIIPAIAGGA